MHVKNKSNKKKCYENLKKKKKKGNLHLDPEAGGRGWECASLLKSQVHPLAYLFQQRPHFLILTKQFHQVGPSI